MELERSSRLPTRGFKEFIVLVDMEEVNLDGVADGGVKYDRKRGRQAVRM